MHTQTLFEGIISYFRNPADQAAFQAQKDSPNGKKTMKSYLWSLEKAAYDQAHNG